MLNILLDMPTSFWTDEVIKLVIYYAVIFLIILLTLILMGVFRRKTKREMHPEKIKKACIKAKKYAENVLGLGEHKGTQALLGASKLATLAGHIANAAWYGFQIVGEKKDIVIEGIANELDVLSTDMSNEAADGYVPADVYEKDIQKAIERLNAIIQKLDGLLKK